MDDELKITSSPPPNLHDLMACLCKEAEDAEQRLRVYRVEKIGFPKSAGDRPTVMRPSANTVTFETRAVADALLSIRRIKAHLSALESAG